MFILFQIIVLIILLFSISTLFKIKWRWLRIGISIIISLSVLVEVGSVHLAGNFIDYKVYIHTSLESLADFYDLFLMEIVVFIFSVILLSIAVYYMLIKLCNSSFSRKIIMLPLSMISFTLLCFPNGIVHEGYQIYKIVNSKQTDFNEALEAVGIPVDKYIKPENVSAKRGKNIIVISIESLEKGFLTKSFDGWAPNLTKLSKEWTLYDIKPTPGCGWTSGSLYCYMTGLPALYNGSGNNFFQGTQGTKIVGLNHILKKAGYDTMFLKGNIHYSGTSSLLETYGIPYHSNDNPLISHPYVKHGWHDLDLFDEAKVQISHFLTSKDKPFALFMTTIDTHFPNGMYDKRLERYIEKQESDIKFAVKGIDYIIKNFLEYLEIKGLLDNTVIYIFPDHKMMGSSSIINRLDKQERKTYFLTNASENTLGHATNEILSQIDLPRLIIDGAEIKTNAKFLLDYLDVKDVNAYIENNKEALTTLNASGLIRANLRDGFTISVDNERVVIKDSSGEIAENIPLIDEITLTSSEFTTHQSIPSLINIKPTKSQIEEHFRPKRGLNLLTRDHNGYYNISFFDTHKNLEAGQCFVKELEKTIKNKEFWAVISHDTFKIPSKIVGKLDKLGLHKLKTLNGRFAYIAFENEQGLIQELASKTTVNTTIKRKTPSKLIDLTFNKRMNKLRMNQIQPKQLFSFGEYEKLQSWMHLIISIKDNKLHRVYLGDKELTGNVKLGESVTYLASEVETLVKSNQLNLDIGKSHEIDLKIEKNKNTLALGDKVFNLEKGMNLFSLNQNSEFYSVIARPIAELEEIIKKIKILKENQKPWLLAANHTNGIDAEMANNPSLVNLGFKKLQQLTKEDVYLNFGEEFLSKDSIDKTFFFQRDIMADKIFDRIESADGKIIYTKLKQTGYYNHLNFAEIQVTSSEFSTSKLINSQIIVKDKKYLLSRGLNVFYFDSTLDEYTLKNFDSHGKKHLIQDFTKKIKELNEKHTPWLIVSHDTVKSYPEFKQSLIKLGLKKLADLDGRSAYIAYKRKGKLREEVAKKSLTLLLSANKAQILTTIPLTPIKKINITQSQIQLTASEFITSKQIKSQIKVGNKVSLLRRGLNLLVFSDDKGNYLVEQFDTHGNKDKQKEFLQRIEYLNNLGRFWAVASHDSIKMAPEFIDMAKSMGLKKLPMLNGREAYVAYMSNDGIEESTAKKSISLLIDAPTNFTHINKKE